MVVLTIDGRSWQTLSFQEKVDLVSIRAPDDKTATVTEMTYFYKDDGGTIKFSNVYLGTAAYPPRQKVSRASRIAASGSYARGLPRRLVTKQILY